MKPWQNIYKVLDTSRCNGHSLRAEIICLRDIFDEIMATFTRIHEDEGPSISVEVSRRLAKIGKLSTVPLGCLRRQLLTNCIDPNIYGGFTECVYILSLLITIAFAFDLLFEPAIWLVIPLPLPGNHPSVVFQSYFKRMHSPKKLKRCIWKYS